MSKIKKYLFLYYFSIVILLIFNVNVVFSTSVNVLNQCASTFFLNATEKFGDLWIKDLAHYRLIGAKPTKDIKSFIPYQGVQVTQRTITGEARRALFRVLAEPSKEIYIVGDFNNWGENWKDSQGNYTKCDSKYKLRKSTEDPYYQEIEIDVYHQMPYGFLIDNKIVFDPAGVSFTPKHYRHPYDPNGERGLNVMSVFWDFDRPHAPKVTGSVDLRGKPLVILETDLFGLVEKFGKGLSDRRNTYRYVVESGVINTLKESGINMVWLLPVTQGDDGDIWHFRYLQYGLRAISSLYGTPDEFIHMVNEFKKAGIGLMLDITISHYAINGNVPPRQFLNSGLSNWKTADGKLLYGSQQSPWSTYFYDFTNPRIRRYLIENILWLIKHYGISGIRLDAVDHLIGKGEPHRQYEATLGKYYNYPQAALSFIKELIATVHSYDPSIFIVAERFENPDSNVIVKDQNLGGIGANARFSPQLWEWVKYNYRAKTEDLNLNEFKKFFNALITKDGSELFQVAFISSHDKASSSEGPNTATGGYLASLVKEGGPFHQRGKAVSFTSLMTLLTSASTRLMQDIILQEGNFYDNPEIDWIKLNQNYGTYAFISDLSKFILSEQNSKAFSFVTLNPQVLHNVDNENKIVIVYRTDFEGNDYYILINLGHKAFAGNYLFGVYNAGKYKIVLHSDEPKYQGTGTLEQHIPNISEHVFFTSINPLPHFSTPYALSIPYIPPYGVLVFKKIN